MTPLTLAADPDRSIAFMRDVVGYGLLPGETSDVESLAGFSTSMRATLLAWFWPQRGYDDDFDPFESFGAAAQKDVSERDLHLRLRVLVGNRALWSIGLAGIAAQRDVDEIIGAVCWRMTCPGDQFLGVVEGTHGLDFIQMLVLGQTLGVSYVDPLDESGPLSLWTTAAKEAHRSVAQSVESIVGLALALAGHSLANRFTRAKGDKGALEELRRSFEGFLPGLSAAFHRLPEPKVLERAGGALGDRERLSDPSRFGEVIADLTAGSDSLDRDRIARLLTSLLVEVDGVQVQLLAEGLEQAAGKVNALPPGSEEIDQGYGWLLMERASLSGRIDKALAELESVSAARMTIRKAVSATKRRPSAARHGETYAAPAPGTRYRLLYEALASTSSAVAMLDIDPVSHRILTTTRGWIDLPPSAVQDRAWWSGSGQSSTGRPQVRAWRAAGYDTPRLITNEEGAVVSAQFPPLPGREDWIAAHDEEERLAQGSYTVAPVSEIPLHAAATYGGPPVWDMDDDEFASLRVSFVPPVPSRSSGRAEGGARELDEPLAHSDAERIERLVTHLREHGETDRRGIEALFASEKASLNEDMSIARWLPNLLTKASRKRQIVNIGTRRQPRWVAAGTAADLAGQLTRVLESDENGERVERISAPRLAVGEAVPADLYTRVIDRAFPGLTRAGSTPPARLTGTEQGEPFLTIDGLREVLAGRRLSDRGVKALLHTIELKQEANWDAAADSAGAFDRGLADPRIDEAAIFALDDD